MSIWELHRCRECNRLIDPERESWCDQQMAGRHYCGNRCLDTQRRRLAYVKRPGLAHRLNMKRLYPEVAS